MIDSRIVHNGTGVSGREFALDVRRSVISHNDTGFFLTRMTAVIRRSRINDNTSFGVVGTYSVRLAMFRSRVNRNGVGVNVAGVYNVERSRLMRNGVGLDVVDGSLIWLTDSVVGSSETAAVQVTNGQATIRQSLIIDTDGQAIQNDVGIVEVVNSTITGTSSGTAATIGNNSGVVQIVSSTVHDNNGDQGFISNGPSGVVLVGSSILTHVGPTACVGVTRSTGWNLVSTQGCPGFGIASGDSSLAALSDAGLQPLADNGGLTMTFAISDESTALDRLVPPFVCDVAVDQRGVSRPQGAGCDAGAYERSVSK